MNDDRDAKKPPVSAKDELKKAFRHLGVGLRKAFIFVVKVMKSPLKEVSNSHNLSWNWILGIFFSLSIALSLLSTLFVEAFWLSIPSAISGSVLQLIRDAVVVGAGWFVFNELKYAIKFRDIAETWLVATIPAFILSTALSLLLFFVFGFFAIRIASINIALTTFLLCYLFYRGIRVRFSVPKRPALWVVSIIGVVLLFLNTSGLQMLRSSSVNFKRLTSIGQKLGKIREDVGMGTNRPREDHPASSYTDSNRPPLPKKAKNWIQKQYGSNNKKHAAAVQLATVDLMLLEQEKWDREFLNQEEMRAVVCISEVFRETGGSDGLLEKLQALVFDTPQKAKTFIMWNQSWSGKILHSNYETEEESCW